MGTDGQEASGDTVQPSGDLGQKQDSQSEGSGTTLITCKHCEEVITHYSGDLWHDSTTKVFPQYCTSAKGGKLHSPKIAENKDCKHCGFELKDDFCMCDGSICEALEELGVTPQSAEETLLERDLCNIFDERGPCGAFEDYRGLDPHEYYNGPLSRTG